MKPMGRYEDNLPVSAGIKLGGASTAYYDKDGEEISAEQAALNEIAELEKACKPNPSPQEAS